MLHALIFLAPLQAASQDGFGASLSAAIEGNSVEILIGDPGFEPAPTPGYPEGGVWVLTLDGSEVSCRRIVGAPGEELGRTVCSVGDLDGDGRTEILASGARDEGRFFVRLYDGESHALLWAHRGPEFAQGHGVGLAAVGDLTGDQVPDFCVGWTSSHSGAGLVECYSGADRERVFGSIGDPEEALGWSIVLGPDIDADGVRDVLGCGRNGRDRSVPHYGILSGKDGTRLRAGRIGPSSSGHGGTCCTVGDVDGDSVLDYVVGSPSIVVSGDHAEPIAVLSGKSGSVLARMRTRSSEMAGLSLAPVGDMNGDGHSEVAVGCPEVGISGGVRFFSPLTGEEISMWYATSGFAAGSSMVLIEDMDGDRLGDLAIGAPNRLHRKPLKWIRSFACLQIVGSRPPHQVLRSFTREDLTALLEE